VRSSLDRDEGQDGMMTKAAVLDTSRQRTHEWLDEIGDELGFDNARAAYAALRATLHALRGRLPVETGGASVSPPSCRRCSYAASVMAGGTPRTIG
jgi:hypothetical protein